MSLADAGDWNTLSWDFRQAAAHLDEVRSLALLDMRSLEALDQWAGWSWQRAGVRASDAVFAALVPPPGYV
jgi:hypothetical protein